MGPDAMILVFWMLMDKLQAPNSQLSGSWVLGASTGVPTHDKVMRESPDGQGESGLKGSIPGLPERLPQNQNLSVLLFQDLHQLLWHLRGLSPTTFLCKKINLEL